MWLSLTLLSLIALRLVHYSKYFILFLANLQSTLQKGAISKYVVRKHLCGAIIQ
jgi:hypothetical protein